VAGTNIYRLICSTAIFAICSGATDIVLLGEAEERSGSLESGSGSAGGGGGESVVAGGSSKGDSDSNPMLRGTSWDDVSDPR
jgi:hypothetical protein